MQPFKNLYKKYALITLLFACLVFANNSSAQTVHQLPPHQPEQDACNALVLCGNSFNTPYSYIGNGKNDDLGSTPCGEIGEYNSVWFKLSVNTGGKLVFKIVPADTINDYDFAVLNITYTTCDNLKPADVVRCNYNANVTGSNPGGIVGVGNTSTKQFVQTGTFGNSFCQAIDAAAGETYLIMVDNVASNENGGGGALSGFTIDFTGSTATFNKNDLPEISSVTPPCINAANITVHLNTEILCSSIAADGSDFISNAPVNITSASGVNCTGAEGYTNTIVINFSTPLPAGNYILQAKKGSDNNTLLNLCNDALALPSNKIAFTISSTGIEVTENEFICNEQLPYIWNGITVTKSGDDVADYTTTSSGGCDSTTILNLTVDKTAEQTLITKAVCPEPSYTLPWDSSVTVTGTFTHHYINKAGCDSLIEHVTLKDSACKAYVYIPTAFTPNTDNKNDVFKPVISGKLLQYNFTIYNRWGKMIFITKDPLQGWDGMLKGIQQDAGTYVWICDYQLPGETLQARKGTVILIR